MAPFIIPLFWFLLQIRGETVENFISAAQDRSRNALAKSLEAAFLAFCEQLQSDQMQYTQSQLLHLGWANSVMDIFFLTSPAKPSPTLILVLDKIFGKLGNQDLCLHAGAQV